MMSNQALVVIGATIFLLWLTGWRCWRMFHPRPSSLDNAAWYFGLAFAAMLLLRWQGIADPNELGPDESQMLAQGMRFLSHPVPWRDVDGTTSGPLNSMALSLPLRCGAPAAWETDRLVLFAVNCAVVLLAYFSLRCFLTGPEAQFTLTPLLLFFGFTTSSDFAHYSSETLASGFIGVCLFLLAKQWTAEKLSRAAFFLLGLFAGALPFAKLQAAPLGMFLGLAGFALILAKRDRLGNWRAAAVALVLGAAVVPGLILSVVAINGALGDFWMSYVVSSKKYAAAEFELESGKLAGVPPVVRRVIYVGYILGLPANLGMFFLSSVGAALILAGVCWWKKAWLSAAARTPLATVIAYCGMTALCFFAAGKPFAHYGMLMIPPLALLIGLVFFAGKPLLGWGGPARLDLTATRWLIAFVIAAIGLQGYLVSLRVMKAVGHSDAGAGNRVPAWSAAVRSASRPGDELSVWGWMAECYVRTGLPPATRDAIGHYVVSDGPLKEYYRARYLRDLEQSRPAIFIDAVGDGTMLWAQWGAAQKHESFPELAAFIDRNYALLASYQLRPEVKVGAIRVYVLRDRLAELHLSPAASNASPILDYVKAEQNRRNAGPPK